MIKRTRLLMLFAIIFLYTGCGRNLVATTYHAAIDNPVLELKLATSDYTSFDLTIDNKTDKDVEIVWDKTLYIDTANNTNGGFMFGNEVYYEDINRPKSIDIVFPNSSRTKTIFPIAQSWWSRGWGYYYLPIGTNGVYLTMRVGDSVITHKLYVKVDYAREERKWWKFWNKGAAKSDK